MMLDRAPNVNGTKNRHHVDTGPSLNCALWSHPWPRNDRSGSRTSLSTKLRAVLPVRRRYTTNEKKPVTTTHIATEAYSNDLLVDGSQMAVPSSSGGSQCMCGWNDNQHAYLCRGCRCCTRNQAVVHCRRSDQSNSNSNSNSNSRSRSDAIKSTEAKKRRWIKEEKQCHEQGVVVCLHGRHPCPE